MSEPVYAIRLAEEIGQLAQTLTPRLVEAGVILMREGEPGDRAYLIQDGDIEIIKALGTDDERLLSVSTPGEFVGEMSLLNPDQPRAASARTRTPTRVLELTPADFEVLLSHNPVLMFDMTRELSRRLRDTDNATIRDLRAKNAALTQAYEDLKAAQAQIIEKEKLEHELDMARQIQESLLPRFLPPLAGYQFGARMLPARAVGGDFFDVFPLTENQMALVVGDVCDKGVPSALVMAMTRSMLRLEAARNSAPDQVLRAVNQHLLDINDSGLFVTVLYGILDQLTGEFNYVRAAHEVPILLSGQGEALVTQRGPGQPLGVFDEPELEQQALVIPPDGTLLLHSDGASDALDPQGVAFGYARLREAVRAYRDLPAQTVCDRLIEDLTQYRGGVPQHDDITLMVVARAV